MYEISSNTLKDYAYNFSLLEMTFEKEERGFGLGGWNLICIAREIQ